LIGKDALSLLLQYAGNSRVIVPAFKTLDLLLTNACFADLSPNK